MTANHVLCFMIVANHWPIQSSTPSYTASPLHQFGTP